jgi:hypothetical protein
MNISVCHELTMGEEKDDEGHAVPFLTDSLFQEFCEV